MPRAALLPITHPVTIRMSDGIYPTTTINPDGIHEVYLDWNAEVAVRDALALSHDELILRISPMSTPHRVSRMDNDMSTCRRPWLSETIISVVDFTFSP